MLSCNKTRSDSYLALFSMKTSLLLSSKDGPYLWISGGSFEGDAEDPDRLRKFSLWGLSKLEARLCVSKVLLKEGAASNLLWLLRLHFLEV